MRAIRGSSSSRFGKIPAMDEKTDLIYGPPGRALRKLYAGSGAFTPPARTLAGITSEQAAARPAGAPHSIAEIVAHMHFWQEWALGAAAGDAPPIPEHAELGWPSDLEWEALRDAYLAGVSRAEGVALDDEAMARRLAFEGAEALGWHRYTAGFMLADIGMHNAHHLGQVVLLRQLLGAWPPGGGGVTW